MYGKKSYNLSIWKVSLFPSKQKGTFSSGLTLTFLSTLRAILRANKTAVRIGFLPECHATWHARVNRETHLLKTLSISGPISSQPATFPAFSVLIGMKTSAARMASSFAIPSAPHVQCHDSDLFQKAFGILCPSAKNVPLIEDKFSLMFLSKEMERHCVL